MGRPVFKSKPDAIAYGGGAVDIPDIALRE